MPAAEDRQAKALEGIHHSMRELVRVMVALNANMVTVGETIKKWGEDADALEKGDPNAFTLFQKED